MKRLCAILLTLVWALTALADGKSETIVYINGAKYYIHTVRFTVFLRPTAWGSR